MPWFGEQAAILSPCVQEVSFAPCPNLNLLAVAAEVGSIMSWGSVEKHSGIN